MFLCGVSPNAARGRLRAFLRGPGLRPSSLFLFWYFKRLFTNMSNIPNAPGMPVGVPTQADIARYNSWAARYGQPFWGAAAAPVAAPKARAKAKAAAKVRSRSERRNQPPGPGRGNWGQPIPQLPSHGAIEQGEGWRGWRLGSRHV